MDVTSKKCAAKVLQLPKREEYFFIENSAKSLFY